MARNWNVVPSPGPKSDCGSGSSIPGLKLEYGSGFPKCGSGSAIPGPKLEYGSGFPKCGSGSAILGPKLEYGSEV